MPLFKAHPIERLVEAYLKRLRSTNKVRNISQYLDKAAKLIQAALKDPCCEPAEEVEFTRLENFFTHQIRSLLFNVDVRKHRQSLERAVKALQNAIHDECCDVLFVFRVNNTIDSCFASNFSTNIQFTNQDTGEIILTQVSFSPDMEPVTKRIKAGNYTVTMSNTGVLTAGKIIRIRRNNGAAFGSFFSGHNAENFPIGFELTEVNQFVGECL